MRDYLILATFVVTLLAFRTCAAKAQDVDAARCLVAEARPGPDYPAILDVLARRSRSLSWGARHYCALFVARHPSRRQIEIRQLPGGPGARRYDAHFRAALAAIASWSLLDGARPHCTADHFGDRHRDAARARRMHWIPVDCGATQNLFWAVRR